MDFISALAFLAFGLLALAAIVAVFERRDGQLRFVVVDGKLMRRSVWERQRDHDRRIHRLAVGIQESEWKDANANLDIDQTYMGKQIRRLHRELSHG